MFIHNFCSCCISNKSNFVYVLVHGNIHCSWKYSNVCYTCIPFICVDVHLKTILAVILARGQKMEFATCLSSCEV